MSNGNVKKKLFFNKKQKTGQLTDSSQPQLSIFGN